jgi:hypothetical protein
MIDKARAETSDRRAITPSHAWSPDHPDSLAHLRPERLEQPFASEQRTGDAVADANRCLRRRILPIEHDIEMRVKRCDLIHLGERESHLLRQGDKVRRAKAPVLILNQMKVLDQKIPAPRPDAQQIADFGQGFRVNHPPPGKRDRMAPTRPGMNALRNRGSIARHRLGS